MSLKKLYNKINETDDTRSRYFIEQKLKKFIRHGNHGFRDDFGDYDVDEAIYTQDKYIIKNKDKNHVYYLPKKDNILLKMYIDIAIENNFTYHISDGDPKKYYFEMQF